MLVRAVLAVLVRLHVILVLAILVRLHVILVRAVLVLASHVVAVLTLGHLILII